MGGYTCNENVLKTDEFLEAAPYNPAFAETMTFVKDFWNIPEYAQLLEVTQRELSAYVVGGEGTAQETLDKIAAEHDAILREAGYITEEAPPEETDLPEDLSQPSMDDSPAAIMLAPPLERCMAAGFVPRRRPRCLCACRVSFSITVDSALAASLPSSDAASVSWRE